MRSTALPLAAAVHRFPPALAAAPRRALASRQLAFACVGGLLLLGGCHKSRSQPPPEVKATNNLTANSVAVVAAAPRVGHALQLRATITAVEETPDVSVSYFALNGDDVAQELEQVRQFYLGTVTLPLVRAGTAAYGAELTVPTSVTPPGDYVILCSLDPSDLLRETSEDDNLAEIATRLAPVADPNLFLADVVLDRQSIVLDPDQDDVAGDDPDDVQNADAGGTIVVGIEGTLAPVAVEVFARLRMRRTDPMPPLGDTHDVPLYLWDSDAQRYNDAFGLNGPVQWLPLGDVAPETVAEGETAVDVATPGRKSAHLDLYLPGKLAAVMTAILNQLPQGPPPTQPPPDLTLQAIADLQAFFEGARLSQLEFSIVVDVRPVGGAFSDTNAADNTISRPFYLILPGHEGTAPDHPLALTQGSESGWDSNLFGVGFGFDAFASLDARGAIADVRGGVQITVFGNKLDFLQVDGHAQVVPAVDPAVVADGETSGFGLDLEFAGQTVYSYREPLGYVFDGTFSVTKEKSFSKQFFVGPVPVSVSGGVAGSIGYRLTASLEPASLASSVRPFAGLEATLEAGVGIVGFRAGAGGTLTLITEEFAAGVQTGLVVASAGPSPAVFQGSATMRVVNTLTGPNGRLFLFVEYPGVKWCRACVLGVCIPYPCGLKTVHKELTLVTWQTFVKQDVLFDETWCRQVTTDGTTTTFGLCTLP